MRITTIAFSFLILALFGTANADLSTPPKKLSLENKISLDRHDKSFIGPRQSSSVKIAHVIGSDSRTTDFSTAGYYNSILQAEMAKNNLSHIKCEDGDKWKKNTTSGFFVDVEDFARMNGVTGDFSVCRNKIVISVAHYINDRGGDSEASCKVRRAFDTNLGSSEYGNVTAIATGSRSKWEYDKDFAFIKIDELRNSEIPNFKTLKICPDKKVAQSPSKEVCGESFKDDIILPHLAFSKRDKAAKVKGFNYKAKQTSGKCCISGKNTKLNLLSYTCDLEGRSSGAPVLSISGTGEPCVLGIQKGQSNETNTNAHEENYAISVLDTEFKSQFKDFIRQNCSASGL